MGRVIGWETDTFDAYFWFVGWDCISLGFHVCLSAPNAEIHLPFGFIRVGWRPRPKAPVQMVEIPRSRR